MTREEKIQRLINAARQFQTRNEWKASDGGRGYQSAKAYKIVGECCGHMVDQRTVSDYTNEDVLAEARRRTTVKSWKAESRPTYKIACLRGLLPQCTAHMSRLPNIFEGVYVVYAYEFQDRHAYIGLTSNQERRWSRHARSGPVHDYILITGATPERKILRERLMSPYEAATAEREEMRRYRAEGWTLLNEAKGGSVGNIAPLRWTREEMLETARRFRTRIAWQNDHPQMYRLAIRLGLKTECTAHMERYLGKRWTDDALIARAAEFTSLSEFRQADPSCYVVMRRQSPEFRESAMRHMTRKRRDPRA